MTEFQKELLRIAKERVIELHETIAQNYEAMKVTDNMLLVITMKRQIKYAKEWLELNQYIVDGFTK